MKVLILGGTGMAGHMIKGYFEKKTDEYEVYYTTRLPDDSRGIYLDVTDTNKLEEVIAKLRPEITINCIGILNETAEKYPKLAFQVNSVLPHQIAKLTERYNGKLIHISTDCVFSGNKGDYTEVDQPDGTSFYAQSKQLGEIISNKHLTIRTSIIGPEKKDNGIGLFLWFMKQTGQIKGYKRVYWNGVTTLELAKVIHSMIRNEVTGLYHLGSVQKVSKYELLTIFKDVFNKKDVEIIADSKIALDRTIKSTRSDYNYRIPTYMEMMKELRSWMESTEWDE